MNLKALKNSEPMKQNLVLFITLGFAWAACAMPPAKLQQRLGDGERLTLIDIRPASRFQQGHIPNAINVPASLVPAKQLPPLGQVVVYDDGLGEETAAAAVTALNLKQGIQAEALDGGFAAWEMAQGASTAGRGLRHEDMPMVTYAQLKKHQGTDLVFLDLRSQKSKDALHQPAQPLTDLQAEFPHARVSRSVSDEAVHAKNSSSSAVPPLLVLIDNGDGTAQETARTLRAGGLKRCVVFVGGEEMLARKGQPGLDRASGTIVLHNRPGAQNQPSQ